MTETTPLAIIPVGPVVDHPAPEPPKALPWALNTIHVGDSLTWLRKLPDQYVNCVVTSPPYNLRNSTGNGLKAENSKSLWSNQPMRHGYGGFYTDDMPHDKYIAWQRAVLSECMRVLSPTGAIFYNHKWRVQNGLLQRLVDEITEGLPVRQIIIWDRCGGFNFNDGYFVPSYEVIYLLAGDGFKLQPGTSGLQDIWHIPPQQNKEHPNAFPESLVKRCLLSATGPGGIVLDPFMGAGTTAKVARDHGRQYIGCELNPDYVRIAENRLRLPFEPRVIEKPSKSLNDLPLFAGVLS